LTTEVKQMSIAPEERKQVKRAGGVSASRFSRETPGFGEFVEVRVDLDRSDRSQRSSNLFHVFVSSDLA
jgi:hypothetical protein